MPLDFVKQIENVGRRIERRRGLAAACWGFAFLVAVATAAAGLDWLLGATSPASRIALTGLLLAATGLVTARIYRAARGRVRSLDVALELERQRPELRSLLASGVEFSQQDDADATAGSTGLRRAVVLRAAAAAESMELSAAAPLAPLRRAIAAALLAAAMLSLALVLKPALVATGAARLVNPFGEQQWPREHVLSFVDPPTRLPQGGDFQAMLRDRRGRLPTSIEVEYRVRRGGRWRYESQNYVAQGDVIDVRWPNVQSSFEYRARGGDDDSMIWRRVETELVPQVESLRLVAHPPTYAGLPPSPLEEPVVVLQDSSIELAGRTNAPITAGQLHAEGQPDVPLEIIDGREFQVAVDAWRPRTSAAWALQFTTPTGLVAMADRQIEISVTPDRPPTAIIAEPAADVLVLPEAILELAIDASDDVGLQSVGFTSTPTSGGAGSSPAVELWTEPSATGAVGPPGTRSQHIRHAFAIRSVGATPGTSWDLRATATDTAGQAAAAVRPLRVRVIAREEFLRHADDELNRIAAALEHAHRAQQDVRRRVAAWQSDDAEERPTSEAALAALARQREVEVKLAGDADSALSVAKSLAAEFGRNQFSGDATSRLSRIAVELESFVASELSGLESRLSEFARTRSMVEGNGELQAPDRDSLATTMAAQDDALATLAACIAEFSRWSDVQRFRRQLAEIHAELAAVADQTAALARAALESEPQASTAERDRAQRAAVDAQRDLAARLASTLASMNEAAASLAAVDPDQAARLAAAVQLAQSTNVQSQLRAAADHLQSQRFGQASEVQRQASESLSQVLVRIDAGNSHKMTRLDGVLRSLAASQQAIVHEIRQLDGQRLPAGELAPSEQASIAALRERQSVVAALSMNAADQIAEFPVFARLLRAAADIMREIETKLAAGVTGKPTQLRSDGALRKLRMLTDAVRQHRQQPAPLNLNDQRPSEPNSVRQQATSPEQIEAIQLAVAQLGLLRTLQLELEGRTAELEREIGTGNLDVRAFQEQSRQLANDQRMLSELAEALAPGPQLPAASGLQNLLDGAAETPGNKE